MHTLHLCSIKRAGFLYPVLQESTWEFWQLLQVLWSFLPHLSFPLGLWIACMFRIGSSNSVEWGLLGVAYPQSPSKSVHRTVRGPLPFERSSVSYFGMRRPLLYQRDGSIVHTDGCVYPILRILSQWCNLRARAPTFGTSLICSLILACISCIDKGRLCCSIILMAQFVTLDIVERVALIIYRLLWIIRIRCNICPLNVILWTFQSS